MLTTDGKYLCKFMIQSGFDGAGKRMTARKGIGRSPELVRRLARKRFLTEYLKRLDHNISVAEESGRRLLPVSAEAIVQVLPKHFELLPKEYLLETAVRNKRKNSGPSPDTASEIQTAELWLRDKGPEEWGILAYRQNTLHVDNKRIVAANGIRFRSKSEAAIAARYEYYGLPYHYDELLRLDVPENSIKSGDPYGAGPDCPVYVSPDFITVRRDGRFIYHEHLGLTGSPEYAAGFLQKLNNYMECGIFPWDNLLITYDDPDGGLDLGLVEALFRSRGLIA